MRSLPDEPARRPLVAVVACGSVATVTGTFAFAYPETLAAVRGPLVLAHDLSGDLLLASAAVYLWLHLRRTWRLTTLPLSWWTGLAAAGLLAFVGATGIFGQLAPMPSGGPASTAHALASLAFLAAACFHAAWGLRRRIR